MLSWTAPAINDNGTLGNLKLNSVDGKQFRSEINAELSVGKSTVSSATCFSNGADIQLSSGAVNSNLRITFTTANDGYYLDVNSDNGNVSTISITDWVGSGTVASIQVPYLLWDVQRLKSASLFAYSYFDWTKSSASHLSRNSAQYVRLTHNQGHVIRERIVLKINRKFDSVLPALQNARSKFMEDLSGRTVIDIWGPDFKGISDSLVRLRGAGISNCVIIVHNWQHLGYDNGLPGHYPANDSLGGDGALSTVLANARSMQCLAALHENYVDYYPNFERFDPAQLAKDQNGKIALAWLNPSTGIQSLATDPALFVTIASTQSPEIHKRYNTSASFIDVNSAVTPWWRVDLDPSHRSVGTFLPFLKGSLDLWDFERRTHGGPVFGEGNHHMFWAGFIDGVEAQFGDVPSSIPGPERSLFVNFDLLEIHPRSVNHGMGYYPRWNRPGETFSLDRMKELDQYRMQEVVFGHAPFVGTELWQNPVYSLIEQGLVGPAAKRYGPSVVKTIRYQINGTWKSTEDAIEAADWRRPLVEYANGDRVVANDTDRSMTWEGLEVAPYGWAAKGIDLLSYTGIQDGHIVDFSATSSSYFANPRNIEDYTGMFGIASPSVLSFLPVDSRTAKFQIEWTPLQKMPSDYLKEFVHFIPLSEPKEAVPLFQADRFPTPSTPEWMPGQKVDIQPLTVIIPQSVKDGLYKMIVGLYLPSTGKRVPLTCQLDGADRCYLGDLKISNGGRDLAFRIVGSSSKGTESRLNSPGIQVNFGILKADSIISMHKASGQWTAEHYPLFRKTTLWLRSDKFPIPHLVRCSGGNGDQYPSDTEGFWPIRLGEGESCSW